MHRLAIALLLATSCAAPPRAATSLELEGLHMQVTTTRATRAGDAELPLLIVLTWARGTPDELLAETGYLDLAVPARIVAIQGPEPDGAGRSWWHRTRPAPDDPDRDDELVQRLTARTAQLADAIAAIRRHFATRSLPVISGISQGGDLSLALGVRYPDAIAAALPIAARFPAAMWPREPATAARPIDVFQGAADDKAPLPPLTRALAALRDRGFSVELHAYAGVGHEVGPAERADLLACAALRLRGRTAPCPRGAAMP